MAMKSMKIEQALTVIQLYIDLGAQFARFGAHDQAGVCRESAKALLDDLAGSEAQKKDGGD